MKGKFRRNTITVHFWYTNSVAYKTLFNNNIKYIFRTQSIIFFFPCLSCFTLLFSEGDLKFERMTEKQMRVLSRGALAASWKGSTEWAPVHRSGKWHYNFPSFPSHYSICNNVVIYQPPTRSTFSSLKDSIRLEMRIQELQVE